MQQSHKIMQQNTTLELFTFSFINTRGTVQTIERLTELISCKYLKMLLLKLKNPNYMITLNRIAERKGGIEALEKLLSRLNFDDSE